MSYLLCNYLIHFGVETVFLLIALWFMIKLQKLNYNFLGLVGAAALASAIDLLPLPLVITSFISCTVLFFCIAKVTGAERVDATFTVGVGYALWFGMNLFLLGALLGDLRPSAREAENRRFKEKMEHNEVTARAREAAAPATNRTPLGAKPQTAKSPEQPLPQLSVKSLIRNGAKSCVTLQSETDSRMIFLGDTEMVQTATGRIQVRFVGLTDQFVLLTVGEQQIKLAAR